MTRTTWRPRLRAGGSDRIADSIADSIAAARETRFLQETGFLGGVLVAISRRVCQQNADKGSFIADISRSSHGAAGNLFGNLKELRRPHRRRGRFTLVRDTIMFGTFKITAGLAATVLLLGGAFCALAQEEKPVKPVPLSKDVVWKLQVIEQAPLKIVRTQDFPRGRLWIFELTRDLDVYEDGVHWGPAFKQLRPRFRFELHNADGIVLKTVDARYVGDYVNKAGKRFGAFLDVPNELAAEVKTIEAVMK
jgi:hypothetical protein